MSKTFNESVQKAVDLTLQGCELKDLSLIKQGLVLLDSLGWNLAMVQQHISFGSNLFDHVQNTVGNILFDGFGVGNRYTKEMYARDVITVTDLGFKMFVLYRKIDDYCRWVAAAAEKNLGLNITILKRGFWDIDVHFGGHKYYGHKMTGILEVDTLNVVREVQKKMEGHFHCGRCNFVIIQEFASWCERCRATNFEELHPLRTKILKELPVYHWGEENNNWIQVCMTEDKAREWVSKNAPTLRVRVEEGYRYDEYHCGPDEVFLEGDELYVPVQKKDSV